VLYDHGPDAGAREHALERCASAVHPWAHLGLDAHGRCPGPRRPFRGVRDLPVQIGLLVVLGHASAETVASGGGIDRRSLRVHEGRPRAGATCGGREHALVEPPVRSAMVGALALGPLLQVGATMLAHQNIRMSISELASASRWNPQIPGDLRSQPARGACWAQVVERK